MKIKKFPKKLPGSFWGITTFFNPAGYKNKYENYKIFRENLKKQGLKLCAVEVTFNNSPFELKKEDAEILIQIRGNEKNLMWQKERMMNIGLKNLPKDCDKIAWLDCDIIFENQNWVKETSELLEEYVVVQPFSLCVWLPKNKIKIEIEKISWGVMNGQKTNSRAYNYQKKEKKDLSTYIEAGHVGFAWAARKEIFKKINFYDKTIIGSGDLFFIDAAYNRKMEKHFLEISKKMKKDYLIWKKKMYMNTKGSVTFTKGNLFHLWHGDRNNRNYKKRHLILKKCDFDPKKDIKLDKNNLYFWSTSKEELHKKVKEYFYSRKEDNLEKEKIPKGIDKKLDKLIGKLGIFLKKMTPKIYLRLKKYFPDKN